MARTIGRGEAGSILPFDLHWTTGELGTHSNFILSVIGERLLQNTYLLAK